MTNRPIRIQIDAKVKGMDEKHVEVDCDDYILLYSKVNGAAFDPEGNKEPSLTREVSAGIAGFKETSDIFNRLTQGTLGLINISDDEKVNHHNLINFIMYLIHYGGLEGDVKLSVSEKYLSNAGKNPVPSENTTKEAQHE